MDNRTYWAKRSQVREAKAYSNCLEATRGLVNAYRQTAANIRREINDFYGRFARENKLEYSDAVRLLNNNEMLEWNNTVADYIEEIRREKNPEVRERLMREYDARAYGARITRLESLNGSIDNELSKLYARANSQFRELLGENYTDGYYRTIFDIQNRFGYSSMFATVNANVVENALSYPWSGANFSDRLWKHKVELLNNLRETLTTGFIRGDSVQTMAKRLAERLDASRSNALRLIRTESNHIHNAAELDAYNECGFDEYEFMASLGERTCEVCGGMDGKRIKLSDKQFGVNFPPLHPNCRCTTIAFDPDDDLSDFKAGELEYEQWYAKYVEGREQPKLESKGGAEIEVPRGKPVPVSPTSEKKTAAQTLTTGGVNSVDVKDLYDYFASPGKGVVSYDKGYNVSTHKAEIDFADWLHSYYGGDIHLLSESTKDGVLMPDFIWHDKLWDLKSVTTEKAANSAIRKGLKQIEKNPGGVILDYGNADVSIESLLNVIQKRMQWYKGTNVDIMIVKDKRVIQIIRYK